jgi:uncharacterized protein (TIGR04255 family)
VIYSDLSQVIVNAHQPIKNKYMERPPLPDFVSPPITEVALSIQFEQLTNFRVIHLGELWDRFVRTDFPTTEEQQVVQRTVEYFGIPTPAVMPQIQLLNVLPMPRHLFLNEKGSIVLQVQQDRFTVNWRKRSSNDEYPRFEAISKMFEDYAGRFVEFLKEKNLGSLQINQAEVTYVNRIESTETPGHIEKIVSVFSGDYSDSFLHDPEEVQLSLRFPIRHEGHLVGRLYIDSRPGTSGDPNSPLNMVLFARGKPIGSDIKAALQFFAIARTYIVSAFASVTSKQMHLTWGRTDNA